MYFSQKTAERISAEAKSKGLSIKDILIKCELNKNTISTMKSRKSWIAADSIAKIADCLDVSVDYLLGRSDTPTMTMPPEDVDTSTADGAALLAIYNRLSPVDRAKLLLYADNLTHNGGNDGNGSKDGKDGDI